MRTCRVSHAERWLESAAAGAKQDGERAITVDAQKIDLAVAIEVGHGDGCRARSDGEILRSTKAAGARAESQSDGIAERIGADKIGLAVAAYIFRNQAEKIAVQRITCTRAVTGERADDPAGMC